MTARNDPPPLPPVSAALGARLKVLETATADVRAAHRAHRAAQDHRQEAVRSALEALHADAGIPGAIFELGGWHCPPSPFGTCVYNYGTDADGEAALGDLQCIYCGDPQERR